MLKNKRGITLIALVVTIIILLILAGVTINMVLGDNGILNKTKVAAEKYQNAANEEQAMVNEVLNYINDNYAIGNNRDETVTLTQNQYNTLVNRITALENKNPKLLLSTNFQENGEYTLSESIENFQWIRIVVGIFCDANEGEASMYNSMDVPRDTIAYHGNWVSGNDNYGSEYDVYITSHTEAYFAPHFVFNSNNKILCTSIFKEGWKDFKDFKLMVYGY